MRASTRAGSPTAMIWNVAGRRHTLARHSARSLRARRSSHGIGFGGVAEPTSKYSPNEASSYTYLDGILAGTILRGFEHAQIISATAGCRYCLLMLRNEDLVNINMLVASPSHANQNLAQRKGARGPPKRGDL